jgi:hypothetical protein
MNYIKRIIICITFDYVFLLILIEYKKSFIF